MLSSSSQASHVSNGGAKGNHKRAYVHTQCIQGVIGLEIHSELPLDQDAVNQVTTLRDPSHIASASHEVILLVECDSERSTAGPFDDDVLFSREEALRLDDQIMNFQ